MFKLKYIRIVIVLAVMLVLFGFANSSNSKRHLGKISVNFNSSEAMFISSETVENLLIENLPDSTKSYKYMLDLNGLEHLLNQHDMIKSADIFSDIEGNMGVLVTQRQPIARLYSSGAMYIDQEGLMMPLSSNFSARVPLVYGFTPEQITEVYPLLRTINSDEFLKKHIIAIRRNAANKHIELSVRDQDFSINFGKLTNLDLKFSNYKAFYVKAKKEQKLNNYKSVNLQFGNQVVCTVK